MAAKKNKKRQQFSDTSFDYKEIEQLKENAGITEKYLKECEEYHKRVGSPFAHVNVFSSSRHKKPAR